MRSYYNLIVWFKHENLGVRFFFLGATDPPNGADFFGLKTHFSIECGSLAELRSQ